MFFNGHEIGVKAVDKYENYHPVVWLTANDRAGAKNTGLSNDKIMCRITIKTEGKIWRYLLGELSTTSTMLTAALPPP